MIKFLKYARDFKLPETVLELLEKYSISFNPSLLIHDNIHYLAIRLKKDKQSKVTAKLIIWDASRVQDINLSEEFEPKITKVADPKLFLLEGSVYCTFNTGHTAKEPNNIFLCKVENFGIREVKNCVYNERTRIEKNWAFFKKGNKLLCLYSLNPLTVLEAKNTTEYSIVFDNIFSNETDLIHHTIGSPIAHNKEKNSLAFIAHKKFYKGGKRLYLGKVLYFNTNNFTLTQQSSFLAHSIVSLFGNKIKLNPNLISCTYFSGLQSYKNKWIISYGVNDIQWKIKSLNKL